MSAPNNIQTPVTTLPLSGFLGISHSSHCGDKIRQEELQKRQVLLTHDLRGGPIVGKKV